IILAGLKRAGKVPDEVMVSDINNEVLKRLKDEFPEIKIALNDNTAPAEKEILFLAIHPPVVPSVLNEIKALIRPTTFLISLAPKITIKNILETIKCFPKIVRMIPNAGSVVNEGYNPIAFADTVNQEEKEFLIKFFSVLGECPVVPEEKLEAYAMITGMGPTYFWFQLNELKEIAKNFNLTEKEAEDGIAKMINGTVKTLFELGLSPEQVMDLIPLRPLADYEQQIKEAYHSKLEPLFKKLKGIA
ncbi:MAG: pyrroline-5-carboxylate reductase family protein, partial [bacterium]